MEKTKIKREKFYVEPESGLIKIANTVMAFSFVLRFVGTIGFWGDRQFALTQIVLPLCVNVLYMLSLRFFGKKAFWVTSIPALLGVVFFIIKSLSFPSLLHTILCIILYIAVAVIYTGTAFCFIRTKWLMVPLFGLPFLYHVFIEDLPPLRAGTVSFSGGLQEMSVLCIMLSLLLVSFALEKKTPYDIEPEAGLPKMGEHKSLGFEMAQPEETQTEAPASPEEVIEEAPDETQEQEPGEIINEE